ncbi:MAG: hypothetical protein ACRDGF_00995, partial [Chloroflexota bacterium]
ITALACLGLLTSCSAGRGAYSAPSPTPTYFSGTPGTVATPAHVPPAQLASVPTIGAGTPIALSTVGNITLPSSQLTPTVIAPVSSETPIPVSCTGAQASGTAAPAAAVTPLPGPHGPIIGPVAPGPYRENGTISPVDSLGVEIHALESSLWQPNTIFVDPGQHVIIDIKNGGHSVHDFCSPGLLKTDIPIRVTAPDVAADIRTAVVEFTAPQQPGVYQFWSNMPGQAEGGMVGEIIVK